MGPAATVGLDLGGTKILGVVLDGEGRVVGESRTPTPHGRAGVIDALSAAAGELLAATPLDVAAIGVGVPGLVDRNGLLRAAPNLPGVIDLAVRAELERRLGLAVVVDNDATCAAWAERQAGAARGRDYVIVLTLGTGIGAGIVLGGALYRGVSGFAGEVGHMIVDPDGPPCPCGQRGCWERFASGGGLGRLAREAAYADPVGRMVELAGGDPEAVRGEHATQAASEGDDPARVVLARFAWWLALGMANLANAFDVDCFVLGGGLVDARELFLEPTREAFASLVEAPGQRPPVDIVPAALGEYAGAIGAALNAASALAGDRA